MDVLSFQNKDADGTEYQSNVKPCMVVHPHGCLVNCRVPKCQRAGNFVLDYMTIKRLSKQPER